MGAIITFTTDFGLADGYVAAMKGVALGISPEARLIDICHTIRPRNITQAAFVLSTVYEFFTPRTIHLVVVDPGVGTNRRAIILRTPDADFVAPDNGVLSYIIRQYSAGQTNAGQCRLEPGSGLEAVSITRSEFWRSPVSSTFHGRDVFAPVAAHLSLGVSPVAFGETTDTLAILPIPCPDTGPDGTLVGHILHIDSFGNLITDIKSHDLPQEASDLTIEVGNQIIAGLSHTYGTGKGLMSVIGSNNYLEISLREGSAANSLDAIVGDEVRIHQTAP